MKIGKWTPQQILDATFKTFITEGANPGYDYVRKACVYGYVGGNRCAVGHFDSANALDGLEGSVKRSAVIRALPRVFGGELDSEGIAFLSCIQDAHDAAATILSGDFKTILLEKLTTVAAYYKLTLPSP